MNDKFIHRGEAEETKCDKCGEGWQEGRRRFVNFQKAIVPENYSKDWTYELAWICEPCIVESILGKG